MGYDAAATRERIFAAAVSEFAAYGIAGARVDRIAVAAKANKQAIYAYFGDKKRLFGAVLERTLGELADDVPVTPDDLPGYVGRMYDYQREHPEVVRLLLWEALELTDEPLPAETERRAHHEAKTGAIRAAQRAGRVPDTLDPAVLTLVLLGLVGYANAVPQVRRMLGADLPAERMRAQLATAARLLTSTTDRKEQK